MRPAKIITVLFAATAVLGVGACGSDEPQDTNVQEKSQETTSGDIHERDAENKAKNADELAKDVTVVKCGSDNGVGVDATVEVTNSLDEPMEYIGTINFLDPSGALITEGLFNTGTLQPGEKSTEEVPGGVFEKVESATCEVVGLKIDEPV